MVGTVLWVTKGLGPGGAETLLVEMARAGVAADAQVTCAYVLPWKDHLAAALEDAGVRTTCLSHARRDPWWVVRLVRLVRGHRWDVIHTHSPLPGAVARLAVRTMPRRRRPRVVVTEHNAWSTFHPLTRQLARWTTALSDVQFAVTDEVRDSVRGRSAATIRSLRHGIDTAVQPVDRASRRAEFGIGDDECLVVTVANFRPQKDYPNLLGAAAELAGRRSPVRLVCVGQGPLLEEMADRRDALGLGDTVTFAGYRADTRQILAAADIFVLASQWEGLPVAVMEACAAGLPLVLTRVGGIAEQFGDDDAVLVPPGDSTALAAALDDLARSPDRRAQYAARSRHLAERFDIGPAVVATRQAYALGDRQVPPAPVAATRSTPSSVEIRPATDDDRTEIVELLGRSLGGGDPRHAELFAWKHDANPFGRSPMWVAELAGQIVGVRAMMRWEFVRGGMPIRAVRAVDTATDPAVQGQGIFRTLTMHAVEACRAEGIDWVFNTPNGQSRPGYLTMGWREVGRLPAAIVPVSVGGMIAALRSRQPAERWSTVIDTVGVSVEEWLATSPRLDDPASVDVRRIRTRRTDEFLRWRYGGNLLGYRVIADDEATIVVRCRQRGSASELVVCETFGSIDGVFRLARRTAAAVDAGHALVLGALARPSVGRVVVPIPGSGPMLVWRALSSAGLPPRPNWDLTMGDIELF